MGYELSSRDLFLHENCITQKAMPKYTERSYHSSGTTIMAPNHGWFPKYNIRDPQKKKISIFLSWGHGSNKIWSNKTRHYKSDSYAKINIRNPFRPWAGQRHLYKGQVHVCHVLVRFIKYSRHVSANGKIGSLREGSAPLVQRRVI